MDALSALRMAASSGLSSPAGGVGGLGLPKELDKLVGQKIPGAELEKLGTKFAPTGLGQVQGLDGNNAFANTLGNLVQEVSAKQAASGEAVNGLLGGQNVSLHQAMLAMEEASVSFQLMVEVRNKLLESYQELMRMQV